MAKEVGVGVSRRRESLDPEHRSGIAGLPKRVKHPMPQYVYSRYYSLQPHIREHCILMSQLKA